jgi:putative DNA-invertase from lambdoid prophage Rac
MTAKEYGVYLGRKPSFDREQFNKVRAMLDQGLASISQIALSAGLSRQTVYRIRDRAAACEKMLVAWEKR